MIILQLIVQMLQALDYPWAQLSARNLFDPTCARLHLTSLVVVVSEYTARDAPVILLYRTNILFIDCKKENTCQRSARQVLFTSDVLFSSVAAATADALLLCPAAKAGGITRRNVARGRR
jgi:hypothetical protein